MERVLEGPTPPSNRPQRAKTKRRKSLAQMKAARQRASIVKRLAFQAVIVAVVLYALTVLERML